MPDQTFPLPCPSCGQYLSRGVNFCPFCGEKGEGVAQVAAAEPAPKATPSPVQPLPQEELKPAEPVKPVPTEEKEPAGQSAAAAKDQPKPEPWIKPIPEAMQPLGAAPPAGGEQLPVREELKAEPKTAPAGPGATRVGSRVWMVAAAVIVCFLAYLVLHHKSSQPGPSTAGAPALETSAAAPTGTSPASAGADIKEFGASSPGAKNKDAARLALQDALRQGTDLSLVVTKIPKLEKVYQAAQQLGDISPRYQEQVASAEETLKTTKNDRGKILMSYIRKIVELGGFSSEQVSYTTGIIAKGDLAPREKLVLDLVQKHVAALRATSKPDSAGILTDFSRAFNEYAD